MARFCWSFAVLFVLAANLIAADGRERLNLDGTWEFRTDPQSVGVREEWHSSGVPFPSRLQVPGAWQAQGIGAEDGILRHNYSGPAWYRRQVSIPASWEGKVIHVRVGGAIRQTTLYVNGRKAGEHDGFSTPFSFDITGLVKAGTKNTLAFRILNPAGASRDSPDAQVSTQPTGMMNYIGSWGGIFGDVELEATASTWIEQVSIVPDIAAQRALFKVSIHGKQLADALTEITSESYRASMPLRGTAAGTAELSLPMPSAHLWSPDSPYLYKAVVRLIHKGVEVDRTEERFGMRALTIRGRTLLLNGKPLYLRGYGDDNVEVLTGVAPASKEEILRRINLARSFGFNAVRFHSMIPSAKYFEAADEAGMLIMAELPVSYTMHFLPHREFLKGELQGVLNRYRNNPSFLSLAFGNEFNLDWLKTPAEKEKFQRAVSEFYALAKQIDPWRIILSNDGLLLKPSDMFSLYSGAPEGGPTVRHEFGEYYCSLPDPGLISQFTGAIRPLWLESKQKWINENDLQSEYPMFLRNSQRLQQLGRKYQIERVRRSADVTGYHYWLITDYPGGTGEGDSWEEGWFDYFWRRKNITPREGQEINSAVLLLIDSGVEKRTIWNDEPHTVRFTLSNYGEEEIRNGTIHWKLVGAPRVAEGDIRGVNAAMGSVGRMGEIQLPVSNLPEAQKLQLVAEVATGAKTYQNSWDFWVFPHHQLFSKPSVDVFSTIRSRAFLSAYPFVKTDDTPSSSDSLLITPTLNRKALEFLQNGGRVWLMGDEQQFRHPGDATFFPDSGGALGVRVLDHPALRSFPHDGALDLQFFNLMQGGWNFSLDSWPNALKPIMGSIRTTSSFLSKAKNLSRTGNIFEARVGKGQLLVTTLKIREHYDDSYPETVFLVDTLLRYASGNEFNPSVSITEIDLRKMLIDE